MTLAVQASTDATPELFLRHFELKANSQPKRVAVEHDGNMLTYGELNERADHLARHLRTKDIGPEKLVGVCLLPSARLLIALLSVWKAGGAYLPLDPRYPRARLDFLIEDARPGLVLTDQRSMSLLPKTGPEAICIDDAMDWSVAPADEQPAMPVHPDNAAYCIFTSGSTGTPKGVVISHRNLANLLHSMGAVIGADASDVWLGLTTYSFDLSVPDLFLPLATGARLVIADSTAAREPESFATMFNASGANIVQATPSTWDILRGTGALSRAADLRIVCGGEAFPVELANGLQRSGARVWNFYGPTETTVWASFFPVVRPVTSAFVPLGRALGNVEIYILNPRLEPVPVGVVGEIYIGGVGLARGYLNRADLTAERFVPHPFSEVGGARLYRTGDLGRYLSDGNVEYVGRADQQVKLRGYRIELGEVEAVLGLHPGVKEAVVVVRVSERGDRRLVAYVVRRAGQMLSVEGMRQFVGERLPGYMVPGVWEWLEALPLTPNGKVDRSALPEPGRRVQLQERVYAGPRSDLERLLVQAWEKVLQIEGVGINDNFFDLGGDSLLLLRLQSEVYRLARRDISQMQLLRYPTIRSMAMCLDEKPVPVG